MSTQILSCLQNAVYVPFKLFNNMVMCDRNYEMNSHVLSESKY